ncbi:DUF3784 domain-containing protein [Maribacter sp. 2307ULW6-5]|uniref:DUF3784 domain-containing protein n=1 Tax=Maribacter sp. 2307ULW6-5 TaxID=3386275 RepID=UPI0039BC418C
MLYALVLMSLIIVGVGLLINQNNAAQLLSGYNTMDASARQTFDLEGYLRIFKRFHLFLGASLLVFGLGLHYTLGELVSGPFLVGYPLLAYAFFIIKSRPYYGNTKKKAPVLVLLVLLLTLAFTAGLFYLGYSENSIQISGDGIIIAGMYGETIAPEQIRDIQLVQELPPIAIKTNGFAVGHLKKGHFGTAHGEEVKLLLNAPAREYLLITTKDGGKTYYTAKNGGHLAIWRQLKERFPDLVKDLQ